MMGGGLGLGPLAEAAKTLTDTNKEWVVIVLCGHNQKLYRELKVLGRRNLIPVPFTAEVPEYLEAADLVITKPGGLSTAEALALGKPLIIINPLPGQEQRNAEFLQKKGAALYLTDVLELKIVLSESFFSKEILPLAQKAAELGKKDASINISRHFLQNIGHNISGGDKDDASYLSGGRMPFLE